MDALKNFFILPEEKAGNIWRQQNLEPNVILKYFLCLKITVQ